ncbi:MAG: TetR/AcrR family transcriptional regulator [Eubacteriales bacterium]|nr:TetR/AcrR family transcriptional regulator [Eubacteriales bacterium]
MGKIEDKKLHKRQKLLDTAFNLFTEKGLSKTSISDITSNAGVAKGTFYLYFRDKYDLRRKLIINKSVEVFDHAIARLEKSGAETFEDKMIVIIDDVINQLAEDTAILKFIAKNLSTGILVSALQQDAEQNKNDSLSYLSEMMRENHDVEWDAPYIMLFSIVELVGSTCYNVILNSDPVDLAHFKPYLYKDIRSIIKNHQISVKNDDNRKGDRSSDDLKQDMSGDRFRNSKCTLPDKPGRLMHRQITSDVSTHISCSLHS